MLIDSPRVPPTLLPLEEAEPAKAAPPKRRRWWHPKPTDAEILHRAVGVIDERGWATGTWLDPENGRVCLLGAVGVAAVEAGRRPYGRQVDFAAQVMGASDRLVGMERIALSLWNDGLPYDGGKEDPVKRVKRQLVKMAAKAEANGGVYPRA